MSQCSQLGFIFSIGYLRFIPVGLHALYMFPIVQKTFAAYFVLGSIYDKF